MVLAAKPTGIAVGAMAKPLQVLLIDTSVERAQAIEEALAAERFADVRRVAVGCNLVALVELLSPDIVIMDMALPDRDALDGIKELTARTPRPVVMFADEQDPGFVEQAIAAGVCSYNLSGAATRDVKMIVTTAIALFERYKRVESELEEIKGLLAQRRLIERAKAHLMHNRRMTEPEAYAWLRRKAMNSGRKIAHIAAELLKCAAPETGHTGAGENLSGEEK